MSKLKEDPLLLLVVIILFPALIPMILFLLFNERITRDKKSTGWIFFPTIGLILGMDIPFYFAPESMQYIAAFVGGVIGLLSSMYLAIKIIDHRENQKNLVNQGLGQ